MIYFRETSIVCNLVLLSAKQRGKMHNIGLVWKVWFYKILGPFTSFSGMLWGILSWNINIWGISSTKILNEKLSKVCSYWRNHTHNLLKKSEFFFSLVAIQRVNLIACIWHWTCPINYANYVSWFILFVTSHQWSFLIPYNAKSISWRISVFDFLPVFLPNTSSWAFYNFDLIKYLVEWSTGNF